MNLTNDEANKVIEALQSSLSAFNAEELRVSIAWHDDHGSVGTKIDAAIATLQAAKDRPQPEPVAWMHDQHKDVQSAEWVTYWRLEGLKFPNGANADGYIIPLYTHPTQPAVDKVTELIAAASEHMEHAREQVEDDYDHDKLRAFYKSRVRLDAAITAAKSAAPAKVDVDAVMEVVEPWWQDHHRMMNQGLRVIPELRARLTKLFNA